VFTTTVAGSDAVTLMSAEPLFTTFVVVVAVLFA